MTELNKEIIQEETDESVESSDDIFGMIGNKPEQLKSDKKKRKRKQNLKSYINFRSRFILQALITI